MPLFTGVRVRVADLLEALEMEALPEGSHLREGGWVEIDVNIDQADVDNEATETIPEPIPIEPRDLRDGLRALLVGDVRMARTLLLRAIYNGVAEDSEAVRIIEEELR